MVDKVSIYDLVYCIIEKINDREITDNLKKNIYTSVAILLSKGWTAEGILNVIESSTEIVSVGDVFKGKKDTRTNLLNPKRVYFHKELKICPSPVKIQYDYNTGELIRENEEFFLEMRASYTIEDLIDYIRTKKYIVAAARSNVNRIRGGLEWLLKNFDLEIILYMIDIADQNIAFLNLKPIFNIMEIQDYHEAALETYNIKLSESKANGGDKVVPKRRM